MTTNALDKPNPHWLWMEDPRIAEKLAEHFARFFQETDTDDTRKDGER